MRQLEYSWFTVLLAFLLQLAGCTKAAQTEQKSEPVQPEPSEAAAQNNLGVMYQNGKGVATDYVAAVKWYRKAAEQNLPVAQFNLGVMYQNGKGVATNYVEAVKWYRKAAEQNFAAAQCNLGMMYQNGQGLATNYVEAVKWYRKAAEGGNIVAFNDLAWALATSDNSATRDGPSAVSFAEKAVIASGRRTPWYLGTLAAAYAEVGQFEKAVSTQEEAIALLQTEEMKNDYRSRLKLYEAKLPYRIKN